MHKTLRYALLASATIMLLGSAGGAQAQNIPQAPNMSFFVTGAPLGKGGDLGGLAGADAHCQQLATTVGAGGENLARISVVCRHSAGQGYQCARPHRQRTVAERQGRRDRNERRRPAQRQQQA